MKVILIAVLLLVHRLPIDGLQINYYAGVGQVFDQVNVNNGLFRTYFDAGDYNDIVK